jgi:DNA (cytosine-5)-methyltransferase 1
MKHLGDVTKISGYTAPIVDVIIGGSPCQDLSVAGKRAGLEGERSGLFMEQVRIVKEMRAKDEQQGRAGVDVRPRYMVWENVPGAFSSNKGEDFRIVLEELAKVADKDAVIPMPDKGKWTTCGCIVGDGWSIAWRVLDAQFWGVPQRRRRIALVADFGGKSAPEVLFIRKSLHRHSESSKPKRKEPSSDASRSLGTNDCLGADQYNAVILGDTVSTLGVNCGMSHGRQCILEPKVCYAYDIGEARLRTPSEYKDLSPTLSARCGTGGNNTPAVITFEPGIASREGGHIYEGVSGTLRANAVDNQMATAYTMQDREGCAGGGKGALIQKDRSAALRTVNSQYLFQPVKTFSKTHRAQSDKDYESWSESETANTLNSFDTGDVRTTEVVIALDRASYNQGKNAQYDFEVSDKGVNSPLVAKGPGAVCYGINGDKAGTLDSSYYKGCGMRQGVERDVVVTPVRTRYIVRRLTPLECERLQGYPDGWTDIGEWTDSNGKRHQTSDAARYKALGNSIALPPWKWVLKRLCACYERDATMASLFDGIGGFPKIWEELNGKGTCLWASEIEEFPMAVTKKRIGGDT